ncbi:mucin-4 [Phalacrocorax aristotelis]|uniref:mucin-4 n=1 Tax=Phalacrocorax aristotelis TaxID=126867 RepID=UPI003F4C28CB
MAGQRGGLPLLLLCFVVPDLTLGATTTDRTVTVSPTLPTSSTPTETTALLPTTSSTTAATLPPSSPETSTPEVLTDAFTTSATTPHGSSPALSSISTLQARGSTAHIIPGSPVGTMVQPDLTPTGLGLTTGTPTGLGLTTGTPTELGLTTGTPTTNPMAMTPNCAETTIVTSVGTSPALAVSSFGVEMSTQPPSASTLLSSAWVGTALGTSTHQGPAMTVPPGSTSPGTGSASSPTVPAPTATSDEPSTALLDTTTTPVTSTGVSGSTATSSEPAGTTAGTTPGTSTPTAPETPSDAAGSTTTEVTATMSPTLPTSSTPMGTSALLLTTDSTTIATLPPSSPEMGAFTTERSSTSPGTSSTSPPTALPPTPPALTVASTEPLTTLADTTATTVINTGVPGSTPAPSQLAGTTSMTTPGISTPTMWLTSGTSTVSGTPSAATGMEPSSPATDSTLTPEVTLSIPADLPTTLPVCPTAKSNTSASHLFLSLRLTVPLDLGNTTVQELVLSKLRRDLQTVFPCAGLAVEWRGKRAPPLQGDLAVWQGEPDELEHQGLRAAAAVPVTTEGPFAVGTASPIMAESEGPHALVMGTVETSTPAADAEIAESILAGSQASPSFPPGAEPDTFVTVTSEYGSTVPTLMNVTQPLNATQGNERGSAAPTAAMTTAAISAQHPTVTPEVEHDVTGAALDVPLGTTPLLADMKEDVLMAVTRGAEDLDSTMGAMPLPTTPAPAAVWGAQPTTGSPMGAGVTVLPNQGLTTAMGAVEEGVTLAADIESKASANSSSPSPGAAALLTAQQDGAMSWAVGITPEPVGEMAPAAEESPSPSVPRDAGDAVNGAFSTAASSLLPLESTMVSGAVGNPGENPILPGQAALSPAASLVLAGGGDGQGAPDVTSDSPGSAALLAASETPTVTVGTATSLLAPKVPIGAQNDMNPPAPATTLLAGDVGAVGLAEPSLQPAPWQSPTGEQPQLLSTALLSPTGTPSTPGAGYPPLGAGTLPAADDGAETPASPDLGAATGPPMFPSLRGLQPWGTAYGAPQGADGPSTGLHSASDAPSPASFVPDGLIWPHAGVLAQGAEGAGEMAQAGGPGDGSPYADTKSDMSPSSITTQQEPANIGELPAGGTGALVNAELSPPSAFGDGAGVGAAPSLEQVSLPGPAHPGSARLEPDLSGAEGPRDLPSESPSTPGAAAYLSPGGAAFPMSVAEAPASPDLSAAQGAPVPPSLGGLQPWGTAAGGPQGADLPGDKGAGTGLNSVWDAPSSAPYGPAGLPSSVLGDQLGTNLKLPGEEGLGAGVAQRVLGEAVSETGFEPSLSSAAGSGMAAGMDQLPRAGSLSGPASPSDLVAASSISRGDGAGLIPAAATGPDNLSAASLDSETGPELTVVQGAESAGDVAKAGNPETESPIEQEPANTGELPAEGTGALVNAELSPPSAFGDGAGVGAAPSLEQVSLPGPAHPGSARLEPDLSGAEGPRDLPSESPSTPGAAAYLSPGGAAFPMSVAEAPASPDLSAAQGAPVPPSLGGLQPWGTAAGGPQGADLPGDKGAGTGLNSVWDAPSSAPYGPAGLPSSVLGDQLGTNLKLPGEEGLGAGVAQRVLGEAVSETGFEPSLSSAAGSGMAAGMDQLPRAGSLSGPASPSGVVAASSILDPASQIALGGTGSAPGALQPSLGAGPGVPPAAAEGAGEMAGDRGSLGQSQAPARGGPAGSGAPDGEMGTILHSASSSASTEESSSPGMVGEATNGASIPGAGGDGDGLSTGLEAAGLEEHPMSAPGVQSGADLGLSNAKLSQVNVVELPEGVSSNRGPSPGASLGEGAGAIVQIASGALAPSALASPQEMQPLVPVAPDSSSVSDSTAASLAASLLLPGHGLNSGLAPNGDPHSAPGTQSGSRPLVPGALGGLTGDAGATQRWSLEDEVASGMPVPLGEASPRAPVYPNTAPALPSAPQRENTAERGSVAPGLSTLLSAPLPGGPVATRTLLPGPAVAAVPLYRYGAKENDREYVERRVDFNSPLFKPETGFPFGKTLRDSLYFTDNGQIIFPASDNSIFTYPNPPPRGFNGHEEVPMIAVFWDNADFSRGVGTTFYQEFPTLNTAKPPFVRDVEAKIQRYLRSSYSAAWTLKITWEKAPAYSAWTDTQRTVTYQAILTTDGFRSYVLMLYQEGGMRWDYTRLTATNVLIGYTSGDGFYHNDDLTQRPPAAKYRPDQFRGYNTDLRGLWIYKLESRVRVNYRLKCLAWTGRQQEPRVWSQGLPACPCSLQQGQQDLRFRSSRGGWWAARVSMLHSTSPNQHGAGVRCLYDSHSQLIEGRQERYWRPSRQASPYRDQELKLYDWCCNQAGSARLCAHYSEKRPKIGCEGYRLPGTAGSSEEAESNSEEQNDGEDK